MKIEETLMKAQRMIGIGPFRRDVLNEHCENEDDFEKVKLNMIEEHLRKNYKYNNKEIKELKIVETKITIKEDIFIYIAVEDIREIRDLFRRKAEIQRDDLILKNYIPPQLFARFTALNRICKDRRSENTNLKTQVRFGTKDLEVLIKKKGENEPFTKVDLKNFIGENTIPKFDDSLKWRKNTDRMPRRQVTNSRHNSPTRQDFFRQSLNTNPSQENDKTGKHDISTNSSDETLKRPRKETSLDSCHSEDLVECKKRNVTEDDDQDQDVLDMTL